MKNLLNFVLFQACWFALVMGVSRGWTWQAPALVAASLVVHLLWVARAPRREALALLVVAVLGLAIDTLLLQTGALLYGGVPLLGLLAPAWILALWVCFASTFHASMSWLQGRPVLAMVFGAVGAPLSYLGGARLGALRFGEPFWGSALIVALAWAVATPLFLWISARIVQPVPAQAAQSSNAA